MGWIARTSDSSTFLRLPRPIIEVADRRRVILDYDVAMCTTGDRTAAHVFSTKKEAYANVEYAGDEWLIENMKTRQVASPREEMDKRIHARLSRVMHLYQL